MTVTYKAQGETILLQRNSGETRRVVLADPVADVLQLSGMLVVLTSPSRGRIDNSNVIAVDEDGQILWRIAARAADTEDSPYTGIGLVGGELRAYNWDGYEVSLDPTTGQALKEYWRK